MHVRLNILTFGRRAARSWW